MVIGTVVRVEALGKDRYDIGMALSFKEMEKITQQEISRYLSSRIPNNPRKKK